MISGYDLPICTIMNEIMLSVESIMNIRNMAVAWNVDDFGEL